VKPQISKLREFIIQLQTDERIEIVYKQRSA